MKSINEKHDTNFRRKRRLVSVLEIYSIEQSTIQPGLCRFDAIGDAKSEKHANSVLATNTEGIQMTMHRIAVESDIY